MLYPFLIYFGLAQFSARFFGLVLAAIVVFRVSQLDRKDQIRFLLPALIAFAYTLFVALTNSEVALRFYPVMVNLLMLYVFASSHSDELTVIERIASRVNASKDEHATPYLRKLNLIWSIFFALNAIVSGYTAYYRSLEEWALYNGLISYLLVALLFGLELLFRPFYKRAVLNRPGD